MPSNSNIDIPTMSEGLWLKVIWRISCNFFFHWKLLCFLPHEVEIASLFIRRHLRNICFTHTKVQISWKLYCRLNILPLQFKISLPPFNPHITIYALGYIWRINTTKKKLCQPPSREANFNRTTIAQLG